ncbi:RNA polymerase sigma factor SigJ [Nonomuraea sp. NPDC049784]|uniref:RNA polymerase sigma factor SigJ n=1 Tax=Nonomuraea sp. NPDC049784 TaxID=3154361 RepID=UPI00340AE2D4
MPEATQVFIDHRELLFSIVYNMLGSVADTEDVLQETWLAWAPRSESGEEIANPRAYLVRIAINRALARQESISRRREQYVGPWLPEPITTDDQEDASDKAMRAESVSMALLVVLQSLNPMERVVFLLHEVFGYAHTEIAEILDRNPASVRQLAHRAREHVHARRPRYEVDPRLRRRATEKFLAAVFGGDLEGLLRLLAPDVTLWSDGGGKAPQPGLRPIHGRDKVARLLTSGFDRVPAGLDIHYREVNGDPSAVLFDGDAPFGMMVLDLTPDGEQVSGIYTVTNPDKLTNLGPAQREGAASGPSGAPSLEDVDD